MDPNRFWTHSLRDHPAGGDIVRILAAAIEAVDPRAAVARHLKIRGGVLTAGEYSYPLEKFEKIIIVGGGKAGAPMASEVEAILGDRIESGVVVVKEGYADSACERIKKLEAGHPLPDNRGLAGTRQILELVETAGTEDLVVCLISGGGSALLTAPSAGISLQDLRALGNQLLASGASIHEINTVRKALSEIKGGGLARKAFPATVLTLILSDVVGDNLDVIASGPTARNPATAADAQAILKRYQINPSEPIQHHLSLRLGQKNSQVLTGDDAIFSRVQNILVGTNRNAAEAAARQAAELGYKPSLITTSLTGEARLAGQWLSERIKEPQKEFPVCLIAGGETTVTIKGGGKGGRNSEVALAAVQQLSGREDIIMVTLATDGGDGPTDAAGAVVTGKTNSRAQNLGHEALAYLMDNDSYRYFESLGDLLKPGPTQTNVNDLSILFRFVSK